MQKLIILFIGLAIILGLGLTIISGTYNAIQLPDTAGVPGDTIPTPDGIGTLIGWWDATDGDTISIGVGVSQWDDKSGNSNHLVQATGTRQPTVVANGINDLDYIAFDGTDDHLQVTSFTQGAQPLNNTLALVMKASQLFATEVIVDGGGNTTARVQTWSDAIDKHIVIFNGGTQHTDDVLPNEFVLAVYDLNGLDTRFIVDNVVVHTGLNTGVYPLDGITVAASATGASAGDHDIAEIMLYDSELSDDQLNDLADYVETKYDLGITLTGNYISTAGSSSGWGDTQDLLQTNAQSAIGLLVVVLVVLAAVVVLVILRRR